MCNDTGVHTWSIFPALNSLRSSCSFLPPTLPGNRCSLHCLHSFVSQKGHLVGILLCVDFSDGLLSLSDKHVRFSRSSHGLIAGFFFTLIFHCRGVPQLMSPPQEHLACPPALAVMNRAARNIHMQVSVWTYVDLSFQPLCVLPGVVISGSSLWVAVCVCGKVRGLFSFLGM